MECDCLRVHIVDRYMKTVEQFGVKNDGRGLDYFIPDDQHIKEKDIPATHLAGYIGLSSWRCPWNKKISSA